MKKWAIWGEKSYSKRERNVLQLCYSAIIGINCCAYSVSVKQIIFLGGKNEEHKETAFSAAGFRHGILPGGPGIRSTVGRSVWDALRVSIFV